MTTPNARWAYDNLNIRAKRDFPRWGRNRLLDPGICDAWQKQVSRQLDADFNYGGYLEYRGDLWRNHYHKADAMRHLGVDYNVPAGTRVAVPAACEVIRVVRDPDQNGGWGGLVFFKLESTYKAADYFLYGHLAHKGLPKPGEFFGRGEVMARIGVAAENGGWFPHLHVQCFNQAVFDEYAPALEQMDGYGRNDLLERPDMPDPTELVAGSH